MILCSWWYFGLYKFLKIFVQIFMYIMVLFCCWNQENHAKYHAMCLFTSFSRKKLLYELFCIVLSKLCMLPYYTRTHKHKMDLRKQYDKDSIRNEHWTTLNLSEVTKLRHRSSGAVPDSCKIAGVRDRSYVLVPELCCFENP